MANPPDLVLDVGNSRTKLALFQDGALSRAGTIANGDPRALDAFLAGTRPGHAVIGSVAAPDEALASHLRRICPLLAVTGTGPSPLRSTYATPDTLGVDRLANAVAAAHRFPGRPVLAIDLGTCTTYDLVGPDGIYGGGAISPGFRMRAQAMNAYSAHLPLVEPGDDPPLMGVSTQGSLEAGVHHGVVHELRGFISDYGSRHPRMAIVITGGDAPRFAMALESGIFAHPFLTLEGLHAILLHSRDRLRRADCADAPDGGRPREAG